MAISPKVQLNVLYEAHLIEKLDELNDNRYFRTELLHQALVEFLEKRIEYGKEVDLF